MVFPTCIQSTNKLISTSRRSGTTWSPFGLQMNQREQQTNDWKLGLASSRSGNLETTLDNALQAAQGGDRQHPTATKSNSLPRIQSSWSSQNVGLSFYAGNPLFDALLIIILSNYNTKLLFGWGPLEKATPMCCKTI